MKLWLVKRLDNPDYDEFCGFVVRADSEEDARQICHRSSSWSYEPKKVWLIPYLSSCTQLSEEGEPGIILSDYLAG